MILVLTNADCMNLMRMLPDSYVDSIVTDPPYGLSFMGNAWDYDVPSVEIWRECLRVLKPGGHLLSFAGTRTQHRMAVRIEDAGFEIRDMIAWVYGTGFPKSSNQKDEWEGWGTALKPAMEPITMARKPLIGTVPQNLDSYGVGALNIDGCRVESADNLNGGAYAKNPTERDQMWGADPGNSWRRGGAGEYDPTSRNGRWPANLIHDGSVEVIEAFPDSLGQRGDLKAHFKTRQSPNGIFGEMRPALDHLARNDSGSAARFFYCAKASKEDRDDGVTSPPEPFVQFQTANGTSGKASSLSEGRNTKYRNTHPTVKPTDLMRYLCRLVTPPGGTVLDPFMGSGSTGRGAVLEGFGFIGAEQDARYTTIARQRIDAAVRKLSG